MKYRICQGNTTSLVTGRIISNLFVSIFQGALAVARVIIDGSKKRNGRFAFKESRKLLEIPSEVACS